MSTYCDDTPIVNVIQTSLLCTVDNYPVTIREMGLFISFQDKLGIFDGFDHYQIANMDSTRLDVMYAILYTNNRSYYKYNKYVLSKLFSSFYKELFSINDTNFMRQLLQDTAHLLNSVIRSDQSIMKNALSSLYDKIKIMNETSWHTICL